MEKTIATLTVVLDSTCSGTRLEERNGGSFILRICPIADQKTSKVKYTKQDYLAAFTHELGHFVGKVLDLPGHVQVQSIKNLLGPFVTGPMQLPAEKEAWDIAESLFQRAKQTQAYRDAIESYQRD